MKEDNIDITKILLFIIILALIIYIILIINKKSNYNFNIFNNLNNMYNEGFMDYQDIKTKTLNWCNKMQANGLMNSDQYNQCVSSFKSVSSGAKKSGIDKTNFGMGIDYSIYNTRKTNLSPSTTNNNSNTILLTNNNNQTLACSPDGTLYTVSDINDPNINQKEINFRLDPINETTYSIISPYGLFLVADNLFNAGFTGKSAGPLASWNLVPITDSLSSFQNVQKVMIESIQFPNFHIVYKEDINSLQIENGRNDNMLWQIQSKSNSNPSEEKASFNASQYFVTKENILTKVKQNNLLRHTLQISIDIVNNFSDNIRNNIERIKNYVRNYLQNQQRLYNLSSIDYQTRVSSIKNNSMIDPATSQSLINNLPKPQGINVSTENINRVLNAIDDYKNTLLQFVNTNGLIPLNQKLNNLDNTDTTQIDFDNFIDDLHKELEKINNQIEQNKKIIKRQKDTYNIVSNDYNYQSEEIKRLDKVDSVASLNVNLLNNYQTQKNYLNKLYPFIIIILFIGLLYLAYLTYLKFKINIWSKYQE